MRCFSYLVYPRGGKKVPSLVYDRGVRKLESFSGQAYAMLRIAAGLMFAFHGAQKLFGFLSTHPQPRVGSQIWIGGIIEFFGGLLVALGLNTRWAAFICSGTMAVAYFQFHWKFALGSKFFPAINQGELAALYCFVFFLIACRGGGVWSLAKD